MPPSPDVPIPIFFFECNAVFRYSDTPVLKAANLKGMACKSGNNDIASSNVLMALLNSFGTFLQNTATYSTNIGTNAQI